MIEKYRDADAIVTIEGKEYALYKKGPLKNILTWLTLPQVGFLIENNDRY